MTNALPTAADLAALISAKLCHDLISPVSAVVSGLDLIEDPENADMRDEALTMVTASARRLGAILQFSRVAFGASAAATTFDPKELQKLAQGFFDSQKSDLDWRVSAESVEKPAARALMNLAQLAAQALPRGGTATLATTDGLNLTATSVGPRANLRPETLLGLQGLQMEEGMPGHWVQAYYLYLIVTDAGGTIETETAEERTQITVRLKA